MTTANSSTTNESFFDKIPVMALAVPAVLLLILLYSFANSLSALWLEHWNNPRYSHGYLVPVFAAILLWLRWHGGIVGSLRDIAPSARWSGAGLIGAGVVLRLIAARIGMEVPDMIAFVPCLAGVVLMTGGWTVFKWAGPVVAFLIFMFPLPWRVSEALLVPLQKVATICSTYLLQTMGYGAFREGNVINIAGVPLEVVDACSGLRMVTVFLALCGAVAMILERPMWERIFILASAVPLALAVNVLRITATGMAYYHIGGEWIEHVFHDNAGYVMMPLAMALLYLEIVLLNKLLVEPPALPQVHAIGRQSKRNTETAEQHDRVKFQQRSRARG